MSNYISLNEVILRKNKEEECSFKIFPKKRIMYTGTKINNKTVSLCSPQSKLHPQGFSWVDITEEQCRVMNLADDGIVVFRLENKKLIEVKWSDLVKYLTSECMRFNRKEKNHWKLNIFEDYIKISGNNDLLKSEMKIII